MEGPSTLVKRRSGSLLPEAIWKRKRTERKGSFGSGAWTGRENSRKEEQRKRVSELIGIRHGETEVEIDTRRGKGSEEEGKLEGRAKK